MKKFPNIFKKKPKLDDEAQMEDLSQDDKNKPGTDGQDELGQHISNTPDYPSQQDNANEYENAQQIQQQPESQEDNEQENKDKPFTRKITESFESTKAKIHETNEKNKEKAKEARKRFTNFLHIDFGDPNPKYDELWGSPQSFEEQTFAEHFIRNRKWVNIPWTVVFWVNFIIAVVLFVLSDPGKKEPFVYDGVEIPLDNVLIVSGISAVFGVAMVFVLMIILWFLPGWFIGFAFVFAIITIFINLFLNLGVSTGVAAAFTAISAFFSLIFAFGFCCKYSFSVCVLKSAVHVAHKYPGTYFFSFVMTVLEAAISFAFSMGSMASFYHDISPYVYIYVILAYYFIVNTLSNFNYTVVSGVACCWYFLNETDFLPSNPLWVSFCHMIGPTFGPIALGGFLQAIADTIDEILDSSVTTPCFCCVKCCCMCLKCCVQCILKQICRYALIYCGMFGVEAKEGVKRWAKQKSKKMVKQCIVSTIIGTTFDTYSWIAGSLGGALCCYITAKKYGTSSSEFVFATTMGAIFAKSVVIMWSKPIMTMSDALFVGFGEAPQRLETGAHEIMELFDEDNRKKFQEEIDEDLGRNAGCCSCCSGGNGLDEDVEKPNEKKK